MNDQAQTLLVSLSLLYIHFVKKNKLSY